MKCASFFAGVGGIDLGFEQCGFETVYANEFDPYAADTYEKNFKIKVDRRDITTVPADEIPNFDVMLAGFPCQAFSIAGYRQGFNDSKGRGNLFFDMVRIIKAKKPRIAFFENVKNLTSHDKGHTFKVICQELEKLGYCYKYKTMNACEYGNIPQNRERIYIVAFRDKKDYENFEFPKKKKLSKTIKDVFDYTNKVDDKYYYTTKCPFYSTLAEHIKDNSTVYQWRRQYVRQNKHNLVPTLTANMGMGGHNVPLILTSNGIRKLTPKECFNAQGYPKSFKLAEQADCRLYKQAGNSVCVPVIKEIASKLPL